MNMYTVFDLVINDSFVWFTNNFIFLNAFKCMDPWNFIYPGFVQIMEWWNIQERDFFWSNYSSTSLLIPKGMAAVLEQRIFLPRIVTVCLFHTSYNHGRDLFSLMKNSENVFERSSTYINRIVWQKSKTLCHPCSVWWDHGYMTRVGFWEKAETRDEDHQAQGGATPRLRMR